MLEVLNLFGSEAFIPHGHCYFWKPGLVWLHVMSDALIVIAYYSIVTDIQLKCQLADQRELAGD